MKSDDEPIEEGELPVSHGTSITQNRVLRHVVINTSEGQLKHDILPDESDVVDEFKRVTEAIKYKTLSTDGREYLMCHKHEIKYHYPTEFIAWWKDYMRECPGRQVCNYENKFDDIPDEDLPQEVIDWRKQIYNPSDRYMALCLHGPTRTGKTNMARQFDKHLYFRGSINWNKWMAGIDEANYVVFDDIDWSDRTKYSNDIQKAIFSGQGEFDKCSSDAYMRTLPHGKPVINIMNDQSTEERVVLADWKMDHWKKNNMTFCEIDKPLFRKRCLVEDEIPNKRQKVD